MAPPQAAQPAATPAKPTAHAQDGFVDFFGYAAFPPRRVEQLLVDSENMRQIGDEWERFWFLDQPSHMTPFRTHGGLGP